MKEKIVSIKAVIGAMDIWESDFISFAHKKNLEHKKLKYEVNYEALWKKFMDHLKEIQGVKR